MAVREIDKYHFRIVSTLLAEPKKNILNTLVISPLLCLYACRYCGHLTNSTDDILATNGNLEINFLSDGTAPEFDMVISYKPGKVLSV